MRLKIGIFLPGDAREDNYTYQETVAKVNTSYGNSNGFVQSDGGKPWSAS